jgi:hypothetical protein
MFYDATGLFQNGNLNHIYVHKMHGKFLCNLSKISPPLQGGSNLDFRESKRIHIYEDSILGDPPLDSLPGISNLKRWLHSKHATVIWDISSWNSDRTWKEWSIPICPSHLHNEEILLHNRLQGKSILSSSTMDSHG